jgi:DNA-binding NarL/FixJ family response regulator
LKTLAGQRRSGKNIRKGGVLVEKPTQPLRVLVVDDHALVREGVAALLREEPDLEVVGEAADGETALRLAAESSPDVVVMDIGLPDMTGIEVTRRLREKLPGVRVLALTVH